MNEINHNVKEIMDAKLQKVVVIVTRWSVMHDKIKMLQELLILEEQEGAVNFKFGVIYALNEQKSDDEMLSNGKKISFVHFYWTYKFFWIFFCFAEDGSETFKNFLNLLGSKIQLQGWTKFRGGLDTKSNNDLHIIYFSSFYKTRLCKT